MQTNQDMIQVRRRLIEDVSGGGFQVKKLREEVSYRDALASAARRIYASVICMKYWIKQRCTMQKY